MSSSHIIRLSKDALVYGFGSALTSFIGIVLVPLLTRTFSPAEYGILDLLVTVVYLANVVLTFGFDTAAAILFFATDDEKQRRDILSTSMIFSLLLSTATGLAGFFAAPTFSNILTHTPLHADALRYVLLLFPTAHLLGFALATLRYRFMRVRYLAVVAVNVALTIGLTLYFVQVQQRGIAGYFFAWWIATLCAGILALLFGVTNYRPRIHKATLGRLLRLGLPLIPAGLAGWSLSLIDRFFLSGYSLEQLGWYSVGVKIASILGLAVSALQMAWGPFALSLVSHPEAKTVYARVLSLFTVIGGFASVALALFAPEIVTLASTTHYVQAARVVGFLALGLIAYGSYYIVSIGVNVAQKTSILSWTTALAAIMNIGLNIVLIPYIGMIGAALATMVAYMVSSFLLYRQGQKYYPIPYERRKVIIAWTFFLALIGVLFAQPLTISWLLTGIKIIALIAILGLLRISRIIDPTEVGTFVALVRQTLKRFV